MSESSAKNPGHTGYFRDGVRRIDLVLVLRDDGDKPTEKIKMDYLTNILRLGLTLELEPGVMAIHKHLIFVKINAPASVLKEYGPKLHVCRYFKDNHLLFINPKRFSDRIISFFNVSESHEKEWIKIVRQQYSQPKSYSTFERSMIVYKILLMLPFGRHENYVGLKKLLNKGIFLDVFPLHDGPFFAVSKQDPSQYNARQILNYNWVGIGNVFKSQPLNLINEYFGDRVAFFFAFYGFYTFSLIFPAVIGGVAIIPEIFNNTVDLRYTQTDVLGFKDPLDNLTICPRCRHFEVCPFLPFPFYKNAIKYNNIFDKESVDSIVPYVVIWATLFLLFWKRLEYYWMWMWECDPLIAEIDRRAQHDIKLKQKNEKEHFGNTTRNFIIKVILSVTVVIAYCCVFFGLGLGLMILQNRALRMFVPKYGFDMGHYKALAIFYTANVIIMILLEKVWSVLSYTLNKLQNHKTEASYERFLVIMLSLLTVPTTCVLFIYIAFLKARIFTHYTDIRMYNTLGGLLMTLCNPVGCSDELALSLCVTVLLKECFVKFLWNCYYYISEKTDYNQGILLNKNVPCWEREYRLPTLKEDLIYDKLKSLVVQFVLTIVFICGCPFTPIFAIIINALDIRSTARRLVKGFRRPLLPRNLGLGTWKYVFGWLTGLALIVNTLIIAVTMSKFRFNVSHVVYKRRVPFYIFQEIEILPEQIQNEILALQNKRYTKYLDFETCFYAAGYVFLPLQKDTEQRLYIPKVNMALLSYRISLGCEYVTFSISLIMCLLIILYYWIPAHPQDIEETRAIENDLIKKKKRSL